MYIENCTIIDNHANASNGGGFSFFGGISSGGLELKPRVVNTVLAGNTAGSGGAVHIENYVIAEFANVTVMHNTVSGGNGGSAIYFQGQRASTVNNSVLWYDAVGPAESQVRVGTSSNDLLTVKWSDVQGGLPSGVISSNNVDLPSDPSFVDVDGADNTRSTYVDNDYRLQNESVSNDRANVTLVPTDDLDLDDDGLDLEERIPLDRDDYDRYVDDPPGPFNGVLASGYTE